MNRADKLLLAGILLVALLTLAAIYGRFSGYNAALPRVQAVVTVQGNIVRRIALPAAGQSSFIVPGRVGSSTVEIDRDRIRMLEAPCPGQVCVRQGWISRPGQSIVCMPGEIIIRLEGATALDAITR